MNGVHKVDDDKVIRVDVRYESNPPQPIVGVTMEPSHVQILGTEANQNISIQYVWYRSKQHYLCDFHPNKLATLQCVLCQQQFCSEECFTCNWKIHSQHHKKQQDSKLNKSMERPSFEIIAHATQPTFVPTNDDLGKILKVTCIPVYQGQPCGIPLTIETKIVLPFPNAQKRFMIPFQDSFDTLRISNDKRTFTVLSYNILSDIYSTSSIFPYLEPHLLNWNYRKVNIIRELMQYHADIVCLQEVQQEHYEQDLYPILYHFGYEGLYKKKTRQVFTGKFYTCDGCAIFYKRDKFDLFQHFEIEFKKLAIQKITSLNMKHSLAKDNIAIIALLTIRGTNHVICVANTHIMANPKQTDIKIWQVNTLLAQLENITQQGRIPIIIAGDFNSTPDSCAYHLIVHQQIPYDHEELRDIDYHSSLLYGETLGHNLRLKSSYGSYKNFKEEPDFTTKVESFVGVLDYIFHSEHFRVKSVMNIPDVDGYLPNDIYSSDHFAIMTEFEL